MHDHYNITQTNCQQSIIYHPVVDYDTSESIYCHRKSQPSRSQWRGAGKFFMPSQALISLPAGSASNLAHWKLLKWGLHNTNVPLNQTVRGKRLKTTAISLCNIHSMCELCVCERSLQEKKTKQEMTGQQKETEGEGTLYLISPNFLVMVVPKLLKAVEVRCPAVVRVSDVFLYLPEQYKNNKYCHW